MGQRGRPRHPDVLTPREQDVLALIRDGLTNEQIAERLNIGFETAKSHVSEILSKLGVATREEAAAWPPHPERPSAQPPWTRLFAPLAIRLLGAIVVAAALAGIGVLLFGVLRSNGPDDEVLVRPTATASSPTPAEVRVRPGQTIAVQGQRPPEGSSASCEDYFMNLGSPATDVFTCTVGPEASRLVFTDTGHGVLRLVSVELVFLDGAAPSPGSGLQDCVSLDDTLTDGIADPSTATEAVDCSASADPTYVNGKLVWVRVPQAATVPAETQPCWALAPAAGAPGGPPVTQVQCWLSLPPAPSTTPAPVLPVGDPIDLSPDLAVVLAIGGGEHPLAGIERVTRDAAGEARIDVLFFAGQHVYANGDGTYRQVDDFHANGVTVPTPAPGASYSINASQWPYIATFGVSEDGGTIVVALCDLGVCGGGADNVSSDAILYRSVDGGIAWSEVGHLPDVGYIRIVGVVSDGRALIGYPRSSVKQEDYFLEPGHDPVSTKARIPNPLPVVIGGQVEWPVTSGGATRYYLSDGTLAPSPTPTATQPYSLPAGVEAGVQLAKGDRLGTIGANSIPGAPTDLQQVPALIEPGFDTLAGAIHPIKSPFLDNDFDRDSYSVIAVVGGLLGRVTGVDSCLTVHAEASSDSNSVECDANDVLLRLLYPPQPGATWLQVVTPQGAEGYVERQYVTLLSPP